MVVSNFNHTGLYLDAAGILGYLLEMPGVAVLGWGSLVYHPAGDAVQGQAPLETIGEWSLTGPVLPIEFSRISKKGHLTLVIDPVMGRANTTFIIRSRFDVLDKAAANLRDREGCPVIRIGQMTRHDAVPPAGPMREIHTWLAGTTYEAVVWTALEPKFRVGQVFSAAAGFGYLETLQGEDRRRAFRYIAEAPDEITTPLREIAKWPEAVATHEAGHYVIACALNRPVVRLSRTPVDDRPGFLPTIGCRHPNMNCPHLELIAGDLAGAWAQVLHFPESIAERKVQTLTQNILLPAAQHSLYSWLGWIEDLTPVFQNLWMPPALAVFRGLPTAGQITQLNLRLRDFFQRQDVGRATKLVADALMTSPIIIDPDLVNLRAGVNALIDPAIARPTLLDGI